MIKRSATHPKKRPEFIVFQMILPFFLGLLSYSCASMGPKKNELTDFRIWNDIQYPFREVVNANVSTSLNDLLAPEEISSLENWRNTTPLLEDFFLSECAGCSDDIYNLKPVYKFEKGKLIHFGVQSEMGIENLVYKRKGAFITRFYIFQGTSQEEIHQGLQDIPNLEHVLEGAYPTAVDQDRISMEYMEYHNDHDPDNPWYRSLFPTKISYLIDLKKKKPAVRFRVDSGFYSIQKMSADGAYQMINFVEPLFIANASVADESISYSSVTDAFYGNATFFFFELAEEADISIRLESATKDKDFRFSIFGNQGFFTLNEYLNKKGKLYSQYEAELAKGRYLIRVIHEDSDYAEKPLYSLYLDHQQTNQ
jgi:hypothetical protein